MLLYSFAPTTPFSVLHAAVPFWSRPPPTLSVCGHLCERAAIHSDGFSETRRIISDTFCFPWTLPNTTSLQQQYLYHQVHYKYSQYYLQRDLYPGFTTLKQYQVCISHPCSGLDADLCSSHRTAIYYRLFLTPALRQPLARLFSHTAVRSCVYISCDTWYVGYSVSCFKSIYSSRPSLVNWQFV